MGASDLTERKEDEEGPSCAICMQEYKEGDELRVLPCRHEFHTQCVDKWLPMKKICPLCRHDVTKTGPPDNANNEINVNGPAASDERVGSPWTSPKPWWRLRSLRRKP